MTRQELRQNMKVVMDRARSNLLKHGHLVPALVVFWKEGRIESTALPDGPKELAIQAVRDAVRSSKPQPIAVITVHDAWERVPVSNVAAGESEFDTEETGQELIVVQGAAKGLEPEVKLEYVRKNAPL